VPAQAVSATPSNENLRINGQELSVQSEQGIVLFELTPANEISLALLLNQNLSGHADTRNYPESLGDTKLASIPSFQDR
jgi:predicted metal-binding protein